VLKELTKTANPVVVAGFVDELEKIALSAKMPGLTSPTSSAPKLVQSPRSGAIPSVKGVKGPSLAPPMRLESPIKNTPAGDMGKGLQPPSVR